MPAAAKQHSSRPAAAVKQHNSVGPWDHNGKTAEQRGYGWRWKQIRKHVIQRDKGLCIPCLNADRIEPFKHVDHIVPKADGGTDELSNLQCICLPCHKKKTARERKR